MITKTPTDKLGMSIKGGAKNAAAGPKERCDEGIFISRVRFGMLTCTTPYYSVHQFNPLSPTPTAGSQPAKSHAKGNNTIFFNGYTASEKKYTYKTIWFACLFIFCTFLIHSSLICFMLTHIQVGNKQLKKNPK